MDKFEVIRLDMGTHHARTLGRAATIAFLASKPTGGPYVLVDESGPGPQRTKVDSLTRLRMLMVKPGFSRVDWHPDSGPQFRVKKPHAFYKDPLRDMHYVASDIDAGTDYCGTGVIHPIGKAVILRRGTPSNTSTFGSDLSAYKLLEGPGKDLVVYTAEHYYLVPGMDPGRIVDVDTVLYHMNGCIEQGWATPDGSESLAWATGYQEGQCSRLGVNFNDLMVSLGVNPGHPRGGNAPSGILPSNFPTW